MKYDAITVESKPIPITNEVLIGLPSVDKTSSVMVPPSLGMLQLAVTYLWSLITCKLNISNWHSSSAPNGYGVIFKEFAGTTGSGGGKGGGVGLGRNMILGIVDFYLMVCYLFLLVGYIGIALVQHIAISDGLANEL